VFEGFDHLGAREGVAFMANFAFLGPSSGLIDQERDRHKDAHESARGSDSSFQLIHGDERGRCAVFQFFEELLFLSLQSVVF
jgi:hypothetical protein